MDYDVTIIGAGIEGCAIARELTRYQVKVALLEKENGMEFGTSKAKHWHHSRRSPRRARYAQGNCSGLTDVALVCD